MPVRQFGSGVLTPCSFFTRHRDLSLCRLFVYNTSGYEICCHIDDDNNLPNLETACLHLYYDQSTPSLTQRTLVEEEGSRRCGRKETEWSRYADGNVPKVNWNDDNVNVNRYNPSNRNPNLRARQKFLAFIEESLFKRLLLRIDAVTSLSLGRLCMKSIYLTFVKFPLFPLRVVCICLR